MAEGMPKAPEGTRPKGTETGKIPGREGGKGGKSTEKGKAGRAPEKGKGTPEAPRTGPGETPRTGGNG